MVSKTIQEREGAALVFGEFGTGKTTLMRRVYSELRDRSGEYQVGVIENGGHCPTPFQLAGEIIDCFGLKSQARDRKGRFDQIKAMLFENFKHGVVTVLLIDEAQELPAKVLESLRGYLNYETEDQKILQIMLFALPKIKKKLAYAQTLRNRLWKTELARLTAAEMVEMLRWRFTQAGGIAFPFEPEATDLLFEVAGGHPRTTCGLAQLALETAALGAGRVTIEIINKVRNKRFLENHVQSIRGSSS